MEKECSENQSYSVDRINQTSEYSQSSTFLGGDVKILSAASEEDKARLIKLLEAL